MIPDEDRKWRAEFERLGVAAVRGSMMGGKWPKDKRAAARAWLDRADIANWQKTSSGKRGLGIADLAKKFKSGYLATAVGILFGLIALARVLRKF